MQWLVFAQGFAMSAGLIVAIGAQNVFVLTQGARRHRPWLVALLCTACDVALIAAGVGGVGGFAAARPMVSGLLGMAGALFLAVYGLRALRSAWTGGGEGLSVEAPLPSVRAILLTALGVSLLNPHALLDTVVLLGGMSSRFSVGARLAFGVGAATASACWFFSLSLGGRLLAPLLRKPTAWRVLDAFVCTTMWVLAADVGKDAWAMLRL